MLEKFTDFIETASKVTAQGADKLLEGMDHAINTLFEADVARQSKEKQTEYGNKQIKLEEQNERLYKEAYKRLYKGKTDPRSNTPSIDELIESHKWPDFLMPQAVDSEVRKCIEQNYAVLKEAMYKRYSDLSKKCRDNAFFNQAISAELVKAKCPENRLELIIHNLEQLQSEGGI